MNNVDLDALAAARAFKMAEYGLDEASITEFRKSINEVDEETKTRLGKSLFELVLNKRKDGERKEFVQMIMNLILAGADLEYKDERTGNFALLICARREFLQPIAFMLLRAGANVNQANNYLTTPLMAAARHGHDMLVESLLLLGADVNAACIDGDNALMSAKRHSQKRCFDLLVNAQASLTHRNNQNQSFLDLPGEVSFNHQGVIGLTSTPENLSTATEEDATKLIQEAQFKLRKVKSGRLSGIKSPNSSHFFD